MEGELSYSLGANKCVHTPFAIADGEPGVEEGLQDMLAGEHAGGKWH